MLRLLKLVSNLRGLRLLIGTLSSGLPALLTVNTRVRTLWVSVLCTLGLLPLYLDANVFRLIVVLACTMQGLRLCSIAGHVVRFILFHGVWSGRSGFTKRWVSGRWCGDAWGCSPGSPLVRASVSRPQCMFASRELAIATRRSVSRALLLRRLGRPGVAARSTALQPMLPISTCSR